MFKRTANKIMGKIKKINVKKAVSIVLAAALLIGGGGYVLRNKLNKKEEGAQKTVAMAMKGTIVKSLEASGTLEALDQYEVTALVSGDVLSDTFEEGDFVKKDQVLYNIDATDVMNSIEKAKNSLSQSKMTYNEAADSIGDLTVTSPREGTVTEVYVNNGDEINAGDRIFSISDNYNMTLDITFLSTQADSISPGQTATVEITGGGGTFYGTVKSVANGVLTNSLGVPVVNVQITVQNPGGIEGGDTATAIIGSIACAEPGKFKNSDETTVTAKASGTVSGLYIIKGDRVSKGQKILFLSNTAISNQLKKSELMINDSNLSLESLYDDLSKYSIKAPISGKVIKKSVKAGDKIASQMGSTSMAVIADLSAFKLIMDIDELDIMSVKVGQTVEIMADALGDKAFYGYVNNVSVVGTSENGVTTYPVEVIISDVEDIGLIPGLNVTAKIVVETKEDVLMLPMAAVNRGNTVVKADGEEKVEIKTGINDGNNIEITEGLKEGDQVIISEVPVGNAPDNMFGEMGERHKANGGPSGSGGMSR